MKLQFKEQGFQLDAVKAVLDCFAGQPIKSNTFTLERSSDIIRKTKEVALGLHSIDFETEILEAIGYRNSTIQITEDQILKNIQQVQNRHDLLESEKLQKPAGLKLGHQLTIEMETGTGKTYTYIRTMYELHMHYGWSKFIVIVPSIAIREGVFKTFDMTQDHFQELYGHRVKPFIYNSSRPQDIENFASDSRISVMIINTQAFNARGEAARRIKMELDQFGTRRPIDIIAGTNPILIIDEPQSVEGDATLNSMQDFKSILTLRYSATHKFDYNKIFRLDALDAYNQKLVKKIQVKGINLKGSTGTTGYIYLEQIVLSTTKPPLALIEYEKRSGTVVKRVRQKLEKGANLFDLSGEMPQYKNVVLTEIDGYFNKVTFNGLELFAGDAYGNVDERAFRRIQIRETIQSHLQKEKVLFGQGIKVLSLFFIDSVEKYRKYDSEGKELLGEYAEIFEEEYNKQRSEFLDLFRQDYNDYLHETDPSKVHKGYMPTDFEEYLGRDDASKVHNGYFSIDKKNKLIDPTVKRGKEDSDDISAYDLIMKDKERLLSFEEPTRFIFSHSALKEGWDNPNVFQICALKLSDSSIRRRQEVGRGMRLSVNNYGVRQDFETIGDQVHQTNKLTVIASESYEEFAKGLQAEIAASLKDRPQKVEVQLFVGRLLTNEKGQQMRIDALSAGLIHNTLIYERVVDIKGKVTEEGKKKIESNTVPLPDNLEPFREQITKILKSVYSAEDLKIDNSRVTAIIGLNKNFFKEEFKALWEKINFKSIYEVNFDSDKLIRDSKIRINADLHIAERTYEVKTGEIGESTKEDMEDGNALKQTARGYSKFNADIYTDTVYDIVGEIVKKTNLTRRTIVEILKAINADKFLLVRRNPEEFISKCGNLINEVKAGLIINNIVYHKTEARHEAKTVFTNSMAVMRQSETLKKHIYDFLTSDSQIESDFAKALEASTSVTVYAKLPKNFIITTPIANYSPDWAIVFDKEDKKQIYFIAETKGSESELELREIEKLKIHCAGEHFKAIAGAEVKFAKVSSYERMLEIIN